MPVLEVRHLLMLDAIAAAPTLAEAAQRLNITPSALTHRLQEAERRLAQPLLRRAGRRPNLTDSGARLLQAARLCLRELDAAERDATQLRGEVRRTVSLGASTLCGYEWLPGLLAHLQTHQPQIDVEVIMDVSLDPLKALREHRIEVAILPAVVRGQGLSSVRLFRDEMIALLPAAHPRVASAIWMCGNLRPRSMSRT